MESTTEHSDLVSHRALGSAPQAFRSQHTRCAQCHDHVAVDLVASFIDHDDAVRITIEGDAEVCAALSVEDIEEKFDLGYHTKHVGTIFARVFGE